MVDSSYFNITYENHYLNQSEIIYTDVDLINDFCKGYDEGIILKFIFLLSLQLLFFIIKFISKFINYKYKNEVIEFIDYFNHRMGFYYSFLAIYIGYPYLMNKFNIDTMIFINYMWYINSVIFIILIIVLYKKYNVNIRKYFENLKK